VNRGFLGQPEVGWLKQIEGEDWLYDVESVAFYDRPCGPEELELIARLPGVRELMLLESDLEDADLACLVSLASLNRLRVSGSPLGDEALQILAAAPNLRDLTIEGGYITPDCPARLSRLVGWKTLAIQRTCLAPNTVIALRRALPECQIVVDECPAAGSADDVEAYAMHPITGGR
jgi:hypothetical protein